MKTVTMMFDGRIERGPNLTQQEWFETLRIHREANIAKLRAIFRGELKVSKEKRADIERAARGLWDFYDA